MADDIVCRMIRGGRTMKWTRILALGALLIAILISGCSRGPEDAKNDLKSMNVQYSEKSFIDSLAQNNIKAVTLFLEAGMSANLSAADGTPLTIAASRAHLELVKLLVEKGADVNQPDKDKLAPLMAAVVGDAKEADKVKVTKYLIEKGANLKVQYTAKGVVFTPLIYAVNAEELEMVKMLLDKKVDINEPEAKTGITPLIFAVTHKNVPITKELLARGADVNKKSKEGATPLMMATSQKDAEMVKLLKGAGAKN